jgi:hypothetical protein
MAWTTVAEFVEDLHAMSIAGVARSFSYPSSQVTTAELPTKFLGFPDLTQGVETFTSGLAKTVVTIELIVLIAPVLHNLNKENYDTSVEIIDAMQSALRTNAADLSLDAWQLRVATHQMGETTFWAVSGTLTASIGVS